MKKFFRMITNKWLLKGTTTIILVALVIACYIGLNWGAGQLKIENLDFTAKKLYSLSDATKERIKNLEEDITVQLINMEDYVYYDYYGNVLVNGEYVIEYANKYPIASKKVTIEEINDLESRVDLQTKYNITTQNAIIVVKKGEEEKVITADELFTVDYTTGEYIDKTEEAITNAIVELTIAEKPRIYVLEGKAYNDPEQSLGIIANRLIDESNEVELLDIITKGSIPEDCDCLIITTLKQDLSDLERDKILEYINNGGKLLVLSSQNTIETDTPNFDQVLAQYGVSINYGVILEQDNSKTLYDTPNMILAEASSTFMNKLGMSLRLFLANAGKIEFAEATKLEELGVTYETIAATSEKSFVRTDLSKSSKTRVDGDSEEGSCIVGAHVTKKISDEKSSQLIIYSDETFASTSQLVLGYQAIYAVYMYNNEDVVLNSVAHLVERDDTIVIRKTDEVQSYSVTDQEDVIIKTIIFVIPVIIIVIGIGVWIYRRRKV